MTERIILSIVALIMLGLTFKKGDKQTILLTAGLTFGILITWTGVPTVWNVYLCCDKLHQPEMFIFELWQKNMKMILKF